MSVILSHCLSLIQEELDIVERLSIMQGLRSQLEEQQASNEQALKDLQLKIVDMLKVPVGARGHAWYNLKDHLPVEKGNLNDSILRTTHEIIRQDAAQFELEYRLYQLQKQIDNCNK